MGCLTTVLLVTILSLCTCHADDLQTTYQESLSSAVAHFTQSIYIHLAKTSNQENFVFSPLSLHSALSLLYLATKDNSTTRDQLGAAMGIINSQDLLMSAYKKQIKNYNNQKSFLYGNHIWIGQDMNVDEGYANDVMTNFGSEISKTDFGTKEAVIEVNKWIMETTNNKIKKLVDSFSADTQVFLANALAFKEAWMVPFKEKDYYGNLVRDFVTDSGKVKVNMIWKESVLYGFGEIRTKDGILEIVTIPYENKNFEMQIIMPESNKHFSIVEHKMDLKKQRDKSEDSFNLFQPSILSSNLVYILENESQYDEVQLILPTFNVRSKFNAVDALKTLGAKEVFTTGAEFDKISAGGPIRVKNILHEAVVEVTKDGTEGSAATGVELDLRSIPLQKQILVDRPFIFIIQDKVNKIPVLVGRIKNPTIQNP